jgi:cysteate synthase
VGPASAEARLRFPGPLDPAVRLVVLDGRATYSDAIACAELLARLPGHHPEGGVRNVGRRDGLGAVMLAAAEAIGELPDRYVQAVGSGTGALGAHEMARRLAGEGGRVPRLLLCQNSPFAPLRDAWMGRAQVGSAHDALAQELTNPNPPYAIRGGVRDALTDSRGDVLCADNAAGRAAAELFVEVEGIDVEPSVGIALATLADAVRDGRVSPDELVLLNVTGGGRARLERDAERFAASPWMRVAWPGEGGAAQVAEQVERRLGEDALLESAA